MITREEAGDSKLQNSIIDKYGYRPHPEELEQTEDGILAILPDDRIVMLAESTRIRVGNSGAGASSLVSVTWFWERERQGPKGLYELVKGWRDAVNLEWAVRCTTQKRRAKKTWLRYAHEVIGQFVEDFELAEEVIATGPAKWLREVTF